MARVNRNLHVVLRQCISADLTNAAPTNLGLILAKYPVAVEKLLHQKSQKNLAIGSPTNDDLKFSGHFLSPDFGVFHAKPDFFNTHAIFRQSKAGNTKIGEF